MSIIIIFQSDHNLLGGTGERPVGNHISKPCLHGYLNVILVLKGYHVNCSILTSNPINGIVSVVQ